MSLLSVDESTSMSLDSQIQAIWISVGVIGFLAFVRSIFRTWIWSRRSGKLAVDIITLFKFLMFLISGLSNVFHCSYWFSYLLANIL
jgi:meckelin